MTNSPSDMDVVHRILEKWKSRLMLMPKDQRKMENAATHFDELFSSFKTKNISPDLAYDCVDTVAKLYTPSRDVMEAVYKRVKGNRGFSKSRDEFITSWVEKIKSYAVASYYSFYPDEDQATIDVEVSKAEKARIKTDQKSDDPDSDAPTVSAMKKAQQELVDFADTIPELTPEVLAKIREEQARIREEEAKIREEEAKKRQKKEQN